VYLGPPKTPPAGAQFALKALIAFDRVSVSAGRARDVRLHVPLRQLQYWPAAVNRWATAQGSRVLWVGASSRDMRLETEVSF
jgi:beta-glucosidase